jgi:hypothetical protein
VDAGVRAVFRSLLLAALVLSGWPAQARAQSDLEHKVKAAFLFNFLKFVTWPPERAPAEGKAYVLCVVGDGGFTRTLEQTVQGKTVSGHPVEVRDLPGGAPLRACHLVYLAPGLGPPAAELALVQAAGGGILTVHEAEVALPSGVMRFFLDQQRIRFEINTAAAEREKLHVSSRLMEVAERVQVSTPP